MERNFGEISSKEGNKVTVLTANDFRLCVKLNAYVGHQKLQRGSKVCLSIRPESVDFTGNGNDSTKNIHGCEIEGVDSVRFQSGHKLQLNTLYQRRTNTSIQPEEHYYSTINLEDRSIHHFLIFKNRWLQNERILHPFDIHI